MVDLPHEASQLMAHLALHTARLLREHRGHIRQQALDRLATVLHDLLTAHRRHLMRQAQDARAMEMEADLHHMVHQAAEADTVEARMADHEAAILAAAHAAVTLAEAMEADVDDQAEALVASESTQINSSIVSTTRPSRLKEKRPQLMSPSIRSTTSRSLTK
jgi:hypothetical protein